MKKYVALGWVTKASIAAGCPKAEGTPITKKFTDKDEAKEWIKNAKLRNATICRE
jgi:hypothetical protein